MSVRKFFQFFLKLAKPGILYYLGRERTWKRGSLSLQIPPGVFHPGLFFSTRFLLDEMEAINFTNKTVLDIGCGSGALSLFAAVKNANVFAIDINPLAVKTTLENAQKNNLKVNSIVSDLFVKMNRMQFDYVFLNPPFYPRNSKVDADFAWYSGEGHSYFKRFFLGIGDFIHTESHVWMVLSEDAKIPSIEKIANENGYFFKVRNKRICWGEKLFVYEIKKME